MDGPGRLSPASGQVSDLTGTIDAVRSSLTSPASYGLRDADLSAGKGPS